MLRKLKSVLQQIGVDDRFDPATEESYLDFTFSDSRGVVISAFMVDIDHFKQINDRYGHPEGDEVIRVVAEKLRKKLRNTGLLARYRGEEFVVVPPETAPRSACAVAETIRRNIEETTVSLGSGRSVRITVSVGVAGHDLLPDDIGLEELLKQADTRLYEAKEGAETGWLSRSPPPPPAVIMPSFRGFPS